MHKPHWRTAWQGQDIVVYRDDVELDRIASTLIERVVFIHRGCGDSLGDLVRSVVELPDETLLFSDSTGFAGRVNFERQPFWAQRGCIHWVSEALAPLPLRLRHSRWWPGASAYAYQRLPRADLSATIERWPLQGPQTWEQRKWRRIESNRPLAALAELRLQA
jgi:hypothetical protein